MKLRRQCLICTRFVGGDYQSTRPLTEQSGSVNGISFPFGL